MDYLDTSALPPGFGFHPTDVELVSYYLRKKIFGAKGEVEVIPEVDIYKHEPWDLPAKTQISSREGKWHFFNTRDRKYPTGSRSNRATNAGYWKSTGKDRMIRSHARVIGTKKTLVFHKGRPPHGKRTDWIMHEYYLNETEWKKAAPKNVIVLCRITNRSVAEPENEDVVGTEVNGVNDLHTPSIIESLPKTLEDTPDVNRHSRELPSHEYLNCEAWVEELYDPNFGTIPAITGCKIEQLEEVDSGLVYPFEVGVSVSHTPSNIEKNGTLIDGSNLGYPHELDNFLYEDLFWDDILAEHNFNEDTSTLLDCLYFPGSHESGITQRGTCESSVKDIPDNNNNNNNNHHHHITETGIQIRELPTRTFIDGPFNQRNKLQLHKMAKHNSEATNHVVVLENTNCHLDFVGLLQEPVVPRKNQTPNEQTPRIKEDIKLEEPRTVSHDRYIFKCYNNSEDHGLSSSRFRVRATVKNLVRRACREAHVLRSWCAPISPRCMLFRVLA